VTASLDVDQPTTPVDIDGLLNPGYHWQDAGHCHSNVGDFDGDDVGAGTSDVKRRICQGCPVRTLCAVDALKQLYDGRIICGTWGGVNCNANSIRVRRNLAAVAGLPDGHYLTRKVHAAERRRREALDLHQKGWTVTEIAQALSLHQVSITRILTRCGHRHDHTGACAGCASQRHLRAV
jgi:hypothetical protein